MGRVVVFFNDTATTEIYTLSLHDALPIWQPAHAAADGDVARRHVDERHAATVLEALVGAAVLVEQPRAALCCQDGRRRRSEEHTSELQSRQYLVCRLLLEKNNLYAAIPPE